MKREVRIFIEDILESIAKIEDYTRDIDKDKFLEESWIQDAVIRRLEIIGEAVKNVPDDFRAKYPDVPWARIAGMRDVLIHGYFGVSLERVWKVIEKDFPGLKSEVSRILEEMK